MRHHCFVALIVFAGIVVSVPANAQKKDSRTRSQEAVAQGDALVKEQKYVEAEYKRDARFRVAIARGPVLCLISMNYWSNRAAGLERVWDHVLRTLVMDIHVEDPTAGPVVHGRTADDYRGVQG